MEVDDRLAALESNLQSVSASLKQLVSLHRMTVVALCVLAGAQSAVKLAGL